MGLSFEGLATAAPGRGIAVPVGAPDGARYGVPEGRGRPAQRPPPSPVETVETTPLAGVSQLPVLVGDVKANYPDKLKRQGIEGRVVLSIVVGPDGRVKRVKLVSPLHPQLDASARRAARRLRFKPARVRGESVAVTIPYTFHFVID